MTTDATPGVMPCVKAKKRRRNCPANSVKPIRISVVGGMPGRDRKRTGRAATKNRKAVNWDGEKLSRPIFFAGKARPHRTAVMTAKAMWAGFMVVDAGCVPSVGGERSVQDISRW